MVHPGGFEPPTARFVAEYSIQLSYGCIRVLLSEIVNGASGRIRTSDRSVRSRVLYPAELRMHQDLLLYCWILISLLKQYEVIDGAPGRMTRLRLTLLAVAKATLSSLVVRANFADREITMPLLSQRRWCIREDSNLRPLGS